MEDVVAQIAGEFDRLAGLEPEAELGGLAVGEARASTVVEDEGDETTGAGAVYGADTDMAYC